ncbi:MAG: VWA domain-containing protein [Candidatus Eiseniibacteriota bacterium]
MSGMRIRHNESGNVLIMVTLSIFVILGFFALGVEAGRWYLIRAELSKSVDAGALAGAKNLSNPHVDPRVVAEEFSQANFASGFLGTPGSGAGAVAFAAEIVDGDRVRVDAETQGRPVVAQLFGVDHVSIGTLGVAQMKQVEIMLVLDRSGSMAGEPIADLKTAAKSFVDYFETTQEGDKVGLISFATSVRVDRGLDHNFVAPIKASIDAMNAVGATNPEDALDNADGPLGLTDQSALPPGRRVPQFVVFFSDGRPTAFRGLFTYRSNMVDAVACVTGNCEPWDIGSGVVTYDKLGMTDRETWLTINPRTTGDGRAVGSPCGSNSTRWHIFDTQPVPGYAPTACSIPYRTNLAAHTCNLAASLALAHGQELKDKGITIYTIGLGAANPAFLEALASSPEHAYFAPSSDELQALFQKIAKQIKLRMVM